MNRKRFATGVLAVALLAACLAIPARADESFAKVADQVNSKLAKVFGSGGLKGLPSYGTGVVISPDGYILTVYSHLLDTRDLRVHMSDGSRYHAKVVATEPELDVALIKVGDDKTKVEDLPYFDVIEAGKKPLVDAGTGVLAFSNQFNIATREEPMSIQQGRVAAYARLYGRIGIHEAPYTGNVYVIDAITNNPGAAGGALTNRKGELLGLLGKELRNEQTNTWINYAVPIGAKLEVKGDDGKLATVSILDLVEKKENYKPIVSKKEKVKGGGYTGIVLVPNVVERTPPYIEDVMPNSPAAKAGLKPDDLIVYVDGLPVISIQMYNDLVDRYRPDETMKLEIRRGDKLTSATVKLEKPVVKTPPKKTDDKPEDK
jgi:serine protease Do